VTFTLCPLTRDDAAAVIRRWHRHHKPHRRQLLAVGAFRGSACVGVAVCERPKAPGLCNGITWELTRLATPGDEHLRELEPRADHATGIASCLAAACWRSAREIGVRRLVSYTRVDESGTCYRAAGWVATAIVRGREWAGKNKPARWLPGMYEPSTEIVDRVRWEVGPDAAATRVRRAGGRWVAASLKVAA
jgi:hypothetical protein